MKKMFNEGNQKHNFMSSFGSGTVINYSSGSGSDFLTSYGSGYGSGSTSQKVTVPTVPVPVPQHWKIYTYLQPEKIKRIHKFFALFRKSGGFGKYWRFYKIHVFIKELKNRIEVYVVDIQEYIK
jgi:hypothetical protein